MSPKPIPETVRALVQAKEEEPSLPEDKPKIVDRSAEAPRVVKRISSLIADHRRASRPLGVEFSASELFIIIAALKDHALGGTGSLDLTDQDEIQTHCLQRLFEELAEEPSNILYLTQTTPTHRAH